MKTTQRRKQRTMKLPYALDFMLCRLFDVPRDEALRKTHPHLWGGRYAEDYTEEIVRKIARGPRPPEDTGSDATEEQIQYVLKTIKEFFRQYLHKEWAIKALAGLNGEEREKQ